MKYYVSLLLLCLLASSAPAAAQNVIHYLPSPFENGCRLLDTRVMGSGLPLSANAYFDVSVVAPAGGSQGGEAYCGIPEDAWACATGAFVSLVGISPAASGYVRAYPWNTAEPLTAALTLISGQTRNDSLPLRLVPDSAFAWTFHTTSSLHLVVDLVAYTGSADCE